MCFVLCFKLVSWGRFEDVIMYMALEDAIRMPLGCLFESYETLDKLNCFCFLVVS